MEKLVIIGAGRHSAVVADCIAGQGRYQPVGLVDDTVAPGTLVEGLTVLGTVADLAALIQENRVSHAVIAVGGNYTRSSLAAKVEAAVTDMKWATVIHPSAVVAASAEIGPGSMVIAGAVINVGCRIGRHVIINTGSLIDHDNFFDDFASTGPGVTTGGEVRLGQGSYLGIGSTVKHGVNIGSNTVVGGQSFVNRDCQANSLYWGVPAIRIRDHDPQESYL